MHGALLVLLTWTVLTAGVVALGFGPASMAGSSDGRWPLLRTSLWWGLALALLAVLAVNLIEPLRSAAAAWLMAAAVVVLGACSLMRWRRTRALQPSRHLPLTPGSVLLLVALAAATLYLAVAALGPVTNYDSGLYHLGAVAYAGDYATIPGLANLYFPFGYDNSLFPFAAFLGNGPWDGQGFRLANGFILLLLMLDLAIRWTRGRRTAGAYVLLVGAVVALVPMVTFSDYWVTSPTSDSCVLALTLVCNAYLVDALWHEADRARNATTAFVLGVVLVSLRPIMAVFVVSLVIALVLRHLHERRGSSGAAPEARVPGRLIWGLAAGIAVLIALVQSARDFLLSGWLQYPLSIHAFDVAWRVPNPASNRAATLGAARDPQRLWEAATGWDWIPAWLARLPAQWETYVLALLLGTAVVALVLASRTGGLRLRVIALAVAPSAVTTLVWFLLTPPSFRFAWGPVFSLGVIPLACALFVLSRSPRTTALTRLATPAVLIGSAAVVLAVVGYSSVVRLHPGAGTEAHEVGIGALHTTVALAPIPEPATRTMQLAGGLAVRFPIPTDQCWAVYPLCTAQLEGSVVMRGTSLQDGFQP